MNDRERLIELIAVGRNMRDSECENYFSCSKCPHGENCEAEFIADYLIANGVTVQKHGQWEDYVNIKGVVRCSECHDTYIYRGWVDEGKWYYCPNCGAKMDGERKTDE